LALKHVGSQDTFLACRDAIMNNGDLICNKCLLDDQTSWHLLKEGPATQLLQANILHDQWSTGDPLNSIKKSNI